MPVLSARGPMKTRTGSMGLVEMSVVSYLMLFALELHLILMYLM